MYVHPGDVVKAGEELFNVSIIEAGKSRFGPVDSMVKRVLKTADFKAKQMVFGQEKVSLLSNCARCRVCGNEACGQPIPMDNIAFCPHCGARVS